MKERVRPAVVIHDHLSAAISTANRPPTPATRGSGQASCNCPAVAVQTYRWLLRMKRSSEF